MSGPDQNKANVKAFYDLAFNQRQPEEAVKRYVGSSYRQHNPMAGDGLAVHSHMIPAKGARGTCCRRFRKRPRIKTRCSDLRRQLGGFSRVQFGKIAVGVQNQTTTSLASSPAG